MTNKESVGKKKPNAPRFRINPFEAQLVFGDGRTTGEKPDFNGNLPIEQSRPAPTRVSIEEFESDMRALSSGDK